MTIEEKVILAEWEKIINNADEYSGKEGVTKIIERSGLTRESKDNLIAQLKIKAEWQKITEQGNQDT